MMSSKERREALTEYLKDLNRELSQIDSTPQSGLPRPVPAAYKAEGVRLEKEIAKVKRAVALAIAEEGTSRQRAVQALEYFGFKEATEA